MVCYTSILACCLTLNRVIITLLLQCNNVLIQRHKIVLLLEGKKSDFSASVSQSWRASDDRVRNLAAIPVFLLQG